MFDPVVVSSGQTYERTSVQACLDIAFTPPLPDGSIPDFSTLIPNLALKTIILNWCDTVGVQPPSAPVYSSLQSAVRTEMATFRSNLRASEKDLLRGLSEKPPAQLTHAQTELKSRANHFYSSSSEESLITNVLGTPLLSFTTRPSCYSISS